MPGTTGYSRTTPPRGERQRVLVVDAGIGDPDGDVTVAELVGSSVSIAAR